MNISEKELAELQRRRQELLNGPQDDDDEGEPIYEAEDSGCQCQEAGMDSEWCWDKDQQVYVCNGCGEVQ